MKQFGTAAQHVSREDENTTDMLLERLRTHPSIPIFERADGSGSYTPVEMADFITEVKTVAKGLIASGLETGDAVAILSRTRYEWALADWAIWRSEERRVGKESESGGAGLSKKEKSKDINGLERGQRI